MIKFLTLILFGALVVVPTPAEASSYTVTAAASTTRPEANHTFTISGSVSPDALGLTVTLYRKFATETAFTEVASTTLDASSQYSFSVKTAHPGKIHYKVVKSPSSGLSRGSTTVSVTVYRWRYVTDLPGTPAGVAAQTASSTIMGWQFPHSVETGINGQYVYALDSVCTRLTVTLALKAGLGYDARAYVSLGDPILLFRGVAAPIVRKDEYGYFVTDNTQIRGMDTLTFRSTAYEYTDESDRVVFGTPRVYCAS